MEAFCFTSGGVQGSGASVGEVDEQEEDHEQQKDLDATPDDLEAPRDVCFWLLCCLYLAALPVEHCQEIALLRSAVEDV